MTSSRPLERRLGLLDATVIGLGSMIGAGIFAAFTPAARAAGSGLLVGIVIAAIVAFCNAMSSAQLAAAYPTSGGSYIYGRALLGPWWGFFAGWSFVIGKTASGAAMALTFAHYAAPGEWERPVAVVAVLATTAVNLRGITRTAAAARVLVAIVLVVLTGVVLVGVTAGTISAEWSTMMLAEGWYGILQSAGLLFFAFAGYARIATLGEEVRAPERTIPRAIMIALAVVLFTYGTIAVVLLGVLGPLGIAADPAPLTAVVEKLGFGWARPVVRFAAAAACLGALLAVMTGIGRTALAMARFRDLPRSLSAVGTRFASPYRAEIAVAIVITAVILNVDLTGVIGFSSFGVLLYYFVTNLAAFRQESSARRYPRALSVIGAVMCALLVAALPWTSMVGGVVVLGIGFLIRFLSIRWRASNASTEE